MPWTESDAMDQRLQFVTDALSDRFTMTELCARYGVSRRIGYKWLAWLVLPNCKPESCL
jgi:putative transposase